MFMKTKVHDLHRRIFLLCGIPVPSYIAFYVSYVFAFVTGQKWNKLHLTYRFLGYTPDLPQRTVRQVFQQAFQVNQRFCVVDDFALLLSMKRNNRSINVFANHNTIKYKLHYFCRVV